MLWFAQWQPMQRVEQCVPCHSHSPRASHRVLSPPMLSQLSWVVVAPLHMLVPQS